jgi:hypothetical protein
MWQGGLKHLDPSVVLEYSDRKTNCMKNDLNDYVRTPQITYQLFLIPMMSRQVSHSLIHLENIHFLQNDTKPMTTVRTWRPSSQTHS